MPTCRMQENLGIHQFELNLCVQFEAKKAWQHLSKSNPMTEGIDKRDQKALRHVRMLHWHHGVIHFIVLRWLKLFFTAAISKKNLKKKEIRKHRAPGSSSRPALSAISLPPVILFVHFIWTLQTSFTCKGASRHVDRISVDFQISYNIA